MMLSVLGIVLSLLLQEQSKADVIAFVVDPAALRTDPHQTVPLQRRRWIRHRVRPRERINQIAARYGVRRTKLLEWNELRDDAVYPKGRRTLRVLARRLPPPRKRVRYRVQAGETWRDVAAKFRVELRDLKAFNWQTRGLGTGTELVMWVDPEAGGTVHPGEGPPLPATFNVQPGGHSVGRPQRGRLIDGVRLPPSDLYTEAPAAALYGSSFTIETLQIAFAHFRRDTGYEGPIIIGAISRKWGRQFPPHRSHQSGRDVDIRLPRLPGVPRTRDPNPDEIDWYAAWGLVRAFAQTGRAEVIFLEADLQRHLYAAGRAMGADSDELKRTIAWPSWGSKAPLVRHSDGHDAHIHVRIACGPQEARCRS